MYMAVTVQIAIEKLCTSLCLILLSLAFQLKAVSDQLKRLTQEPLMKPKKKDKLKKEKQSKEKDIARLKHKSSQYKSVVEKLNKSTSSSL